MNKVYALDKLDCANCAMKMEKHIKKLAGVSNVSVNFVQRKMVIDMENEHLEEKIIKIMKQIEPAIQITEIRKHHQQASHHEHQGCCKEAHGPSQHRIKGEVHKLYIKGLDCANCANKIEKSVSQMDNVTKASLNFTTGTLSVKLANNQKAEQTLAAIIQIVPTLESGICIEKANVKASHTSLFSISANWRLYIGIILFLIAVLLESQPYAIVIFLLAYVFTGINVVCIAFKNVLKGEIFDENFLMSVATIGALLIRSYEEAVAVMIFYEIGEMFQSYALRRSRTSIASLMDLRADYATRLTGELEEQVAPEDIAIGELILVRPGERVPLDGIIIRGESSLDTSALTGESMPRDVKVNDEVLAGVVVLNGVVRVKVTKEYGESTVSRILELVENASSKKASMEKFITKFAKIYTPIVVTLALVIAIFPPLFLAGAQFQEWLYRALTFLVVSCPCALVISVPLGMFAGIGAASKHGVLIKGGNYLEALCNIDTVVFDKTGTLTKGIFKVVEIYAENGVKEELLKLAAYGEYYSNHPIATSIKVAYGKDFDVSLLQDYEEIAGNGVHVLYDGMDLLLGNHTFMEANHIPYEEPDTLGSIIHVAANQNYIGYLVIDDEIKETSKHAIISLKQSGIKKCVMLSGDRKAVGECVAKKLGLDEVHMQLLPIDKVEMVESLLKAEPKGGKLAFVGDGINDAPVLARADVGVAMGGIGSDAAIEAADVVLMKDDPSALHDAIAIARNTMRILWQNIIFSLVVKIIVLFLATFGYANMWMGVFADVGVTLLVILNSMRALKVEFIPK